MAKFSILDDPSMYSVRAIITLTSGIQITWNSFGLTKEQASAQITALSGLHPVDSALRLIQHLASRTESQPGNHILLRDRDRFLSLNASQVAAIVTDVKRPKEAANE